MTVRTEAIQEQQAMRSASHKLLWVSPLVMAGATVANLILYAVAGSLFPEVTAWAGAGVGQIIGATVVYLLIGTTVFALVARFTTRPARTYWIVATVGLLLSLWMPVSAAMGYGAPNATPPSTATAVTLSLMHVVSYAISVPLFIRLVNQ